MGGVTCRGTNSIAVALKLWSIIGDELSRLGIFVRCTRCTRRFFCRTAYKIAMSEQLLDPTLLLGELAADFTAKADLGA